MEKRNPINHSTLLFYYNSEKHTKNGKFNNKISTKSKNFSNKKTRALKNSFFGYLYSHVGFVTDQTVTIYDTVN